MSGAAVVVHLLQAGRLFVTEDCEQWIRTVPLLPESEKNPEDVDTTAEDHCWDETRYSVTSRITLSPKESAQARARHAARGDRPGRPKAWPRPVSLADALARRGTPTGMDADVWEMLRNRP